METKDVYLELTRKDKRLIQFDVNAVYSDMTGLFFIGKELRTSSIRILLWSLNLLKPMVLEVSHFLFRSVKLHGSLYNFSLCWGVRK